VECGVAQQHFIIFGKVIKKRVVLPHKRPFLILKLVVYGGRFYHEYVFPESKSIIPFLVSFFLPGIANGSIGIDLPGILTGILFCGSGG
jgi:hypothetical protein